MPIGHEINEDLGLIEIEVDRPPSTEDYQADMPEIIKAVKTHTVSKWLIVVKTRELNATKQALRFTDFVFDEVKKYICKIAVVCDPGLVSRAHEILVPIKNQNKPTGVFSSKADALRWLSDD